MQAHSRMPIYMYAALSNLCVNNHLISLSRAIGEEKSASKREILLLSMSSLSPAGWLADAHVPANLFKQSHLLPAALAAIDKQAPRRLVFLNETSRLLHT